MNKLQFCALWSILLAFNSLYSVVGVYPIDYEQNSGNSAFFNKEGQYELDIDLHRTMPSVRSLPVLLKDVFNENNEKIAQFEPSSQFFFDDYGYKLGEVKQFGGRWYALNEPAVDQDGNMTGGGIVGEMFAVMGDGSDQDSPVLYYKVHKVEQNDPLFEADVYNDAYYNTPQDFWGRTDDASSMEGSMGGDSEYEKN